MATIDDFKKLEIVTAKVLEVVEHPNADKLYVIQVDLGDERRQIVAGIRSAYQKEELIGKTVIVLKNLEPAVIRGVESKGMMLVAKDDVTLGFLAPQREVKTGSKVS